MKNCFEISLFDIYRPERLRFFNTALYIPDPDHHTLYPSQIDGSKYGTDDVIVFLVRSCSSKPRRRSSTQRRSGSNTSRRPIKRMEESLVLRIVAIFVIIFASAVGLASPSFLKLWSSRKEEKEGSNESAPDGHHHRHHPGGLTEMPSFRILKTFTGGLLLSVAVIHLLGDAVNDLSDDSIVAATEGYPIAQAAAVTGCLFVLGLELFGKYLSDAFGPKEVVELSKEMVVEEAFPDFHGDTCPHKHLNNGVTTVLRLCVFELSIAIHSVAIGFGLGSLSNLNAIEALMIAIFFHQLFEGVCLGLLIIEIELTVFVRTLLQSIFVLSIALGIILGIVATESVTANRVSGVANAFAAGCLIYGSLVNIIGEEFSRVVSDEPASLKPLMYGGVVVGCGFMGLIAIWA